MYFVPFHESALFCLQIIPLINILIKMHDSKVNATSRFIISLVSGTSTYLTNGTCNGNSLERPGGTRNCSSFPLSKNVYDTASSTMLVSSAAETFKLGLVISHHREFLQKSVTVKYRQTGTQNAVRTTTNSPAQVMAPLYATDYSRLANGNTYRSGSFNLRAHRAGKLKRLRGEERFFTPSRKK